MVRRAAFHASPLSRPRLGSAYRTPAGMNTSRRFSPVRRPSSAGEDVSTVVGDAAGVIERVALPGGTNKFGWSVGHAGFASGRLVSRRA
jgi:hypothetical protein